MSNQLLNLNFVLHATMLTLGPQLAEQNCSLASALPGRKDPLRPT